MSQLGTLQNHQLVQFTYMVVVSRLVLEHMQGSILSGQPHNCTIGFHFFLSSSKQIPSNTPQNKQVQTPTFSIQSNFINKPRLISIIHQTSHNSQ
ncbi:unnamed protein product [Fusarium graminearum]|uniref:Chromosome 3, complete genome n=1 Tax=Gibberella zeae (strain ATCC MYA-4620 / CBS 123657 / FGSC 9075 / NRRL 31084 / PH-1) TaxID=229533 RepID=A0A098E2Q1_GIBZE|nr:unnamed protein product [Fusarium graminearum]CZS83743.1 unnamed protein product [Fusarium graminearum]